MDLDTTIAYDQAEQEDEPHPNSLETSSVVTDNVTSLKESSECDLTDPMDLEEDAGAADVTIPSDDLMNPVDVMDVTPEVSIATKVTDQDQGVKANISWIDKAGDLGLKTLFSESPMVHVYAQPKQTVDKPQVLKRGYHPQESLSRAGRQRKIPAHLQDYKI